MEKGYQQFLIAFAQIQNRNHCIVAVRNIPILQSDRLTGPDRSGQNLRNKRSLLIDAPIGNYQIVRTAVIRENEVGDSRKRRQACFGGEFRFVQVSRLARA